MIGHLTAVCISGEPLAHGESVAAGVMEGELAVRATYRERAPVRRDEDVRNRRARHKHDCKNDERHPTPAQRCLEKPDQQ
jgi:hypothetical protein